MKKIFTLLALLGIGSGVSAQGITCTTGFSDIVFSSEMEDNTGWTGDIGTGNAQWDFPTSLPGGNSSSTGPSGAYSGSSYAEFEGSGNYGTLGEMITPAIDLTSVTGAAELTFYWHAYGSNIGTFDVSVGTSATGPWTSEFTQVGQFQTSAGQAWELATIDLAAYVGQTIYINFSHASTGSSFYGDVAVDLVEVNACVACPQPQNVVATNVTSTGATIEWTANGPTDFDIEWGPTPYTPGGTATGTATFSGTAPFSTNITGLNPATDYDVWVSSDCGTSGASNWTQVSVTTDFEGPSGVTCGTGFPTIIFESEMEDNTGWTGDIGTASGTWDFPTAAPGGNSTGTGPSGPASGSTYAEFEASGNYGTVGEMITPMIDLSTSSTDAELSFYFHATGQNIGTLNVGVSTSPTGPWTGVFSITGEIQAGINDPWEHVGVDLSAYVGQQIYINFAYASAGSSFYGDMAIDLVKVESCVSCPSPTSFNMNGSDLSSIDFGFTEAGNATDWEVVYGSAGFDPFTGGTSELFDDASGSYNLPSVEDSITNLTSNEVYDIYVRAVCGVGDSSIFVGPINANTYGQGQYMESDLSCGPGYNTITGIGTQHLLGGDDELGLTLPFTILHQGVEYDDATIGANGAMYLGSQTFQVGTNLNLLTSATPEIGFYPLWDDYEPEIDAIEGVYTYTMGTAPNRTFVVEWIKEHDFSNGTDIEFQLVIEESTFNIYYLFGDTYTASTFYSNGGSATIGIKGANQTFQESYNNSTFLENNSCLHYYYTNCPKVSNVNVTTYETDMIGLTWDAGISGESNWTIVYGPQGFDPLTGGTTVTTTTPYDTVTTNIDQITDYDIYVYADCGTTNQSNGVMVQHQTAPLCANPFGISAACINDTLDVDWNWQTNGTGLLPVDFNVTFTNFNADVYEGIEDNVGSATFALDVVDPNLLSSGVYDVYVQTVCNTGDTSAYTGPINVVFCLDNDTVCNAPEIPVDGSVYTFSNSGAGVEPGAQGIAPPASGWTSTTGWGNSTMHSTTWYTFVAPATGDVLITGTDLNEDTKMAVYSSTGCSDYANFTLEGANDDGVLFGTTPAPEWTVCGLTPGETYYIVHSKEYSWQADGLFTIRLQELDFNAGTTEPIVNACLGDTVDLFNSISGYELEYGTWYDLQNTAQLLLPSNFTTGVLASQVYDFEYRVQLGCAFDSVIGQVEIYPPSSAGQDGAIDVCKNQPLILENGLSGNADLGGDWYDPQDNVITDPTPAAGNVPGSFNYDYITGNGVCPDDTALVVVNINPTCDYLGLEDYKIEGLSVYPNPTSDVLNINSVGQHGALNAELIDMNGRIVMVSPKTLSAGQTLTLSIDGLETGVYMLRLHNDEVENTFRVVVQ